ncbi:MAG: hypothetical protein ABL883_07080 [Terricaulis sp.]
MMTSQEFARCVHPRELPRLLLALLFAVPLTLVLLAAIFLTSGLALSVVLLIAFLFWFMFEVFYASLLGNWILVSQDNYPRLNDLLIEMKQRIGVQQKIDIIVYEQAAFTSFFSMLFARRAIFITSELVAQGVTDDELRWLIGRWVGWIRAKRRLGILRYVIALVEQFPAFNLFIYPYVRATVYTGDRVGLAAIGGDISTAISTMNKLMVGREVGYSVNPAGMVRQYRRVKGSFFGFLARLFWPLPHMNARYVDLIGFAEREYPSQAEQFANMNPSFQTSGGAWPLMRSTEKQGDGDSNAVGLSLFFGAIASAVAGVYLMQSGGIMRWLYDLNLVGGSNRGYEEQYLPPPEEAASPIESAAAPAAAVEPYATYALNPEVANAVEQARAARSSAESASAEAEQAADYARNYGSASPYSGYGYFALSGEHEGDRFAGVFENGNRNGPGVYDWAVNSNNPDSASGALRFAGRFVDGAFSGSGVYTWRNGNQHFGAWSGGQRSGYGVYTRADGTRYEGQWSNGKRHGYGVEWDAYGNVNSSGYWSEGVLASAM